MSPCAPDGGARGIPSEPQALPSGRDGWIFVVFGLAIAGGAGGGGAGVVTVTLSEPKVESAVVEAEPGSTLLVRNTQVGLLAPQNEAYTEVDAYPLDVESEGMVGYLLEQELGRHLPRERLATLLTQVVVDPDDPADRP